MVELGLFQEQRLKLVMTNELRQAINILHYTSVELSEFLQEQALENPFIDLQEKLPTERRGKDRFKGTSREDGMYEVADRTEATLQENLMQQVNFMNISQLDKQILNYMILLIDHNGYFRDDLSLVANRFSVPLERIETLLGKIHGLDPAGVGARNLKECLLIQLQRLPERHLLVETIVSDHLHALAEKKWKQLSELLNVSLKDIQDVFDFVQTLDPKPGSAFPAGKIEFVTPDLIVEKEGDTFRIYTNDSSVPSVSMNDYYERLLKSAGNQELTTYMTEKYQRYMWLQRSIEQRKMTLIKVMTTIVTMQTDFFESGNKHLKPLTLKEVAEEIDMHESTVSRATNGKYVQTPYGLYELKYFFSSCLQQEEGVSSETVKLRLQECIKNEPKAKPYSDQKIAKLLKDEYNFYVSRRTIAKYRDQLNIPASSMRRRYD